MVYGYTSGLEQPNTQVSISEGRRVAGNAIGILLLDVLCPMLPGDVANASSYNFPVLYKVLEGVTAERVFRADPAVLAEVIKGGKELEKQGVRAITSDCGFFGNYQKEVAATLDVPVFLSSLLQIPLISRALKPEQKIAVLCASSTSLTPKPSSAIGSGAQLSRLDPYVAEVLSQESVEMQRAVFGILNILTNLAKTFAKE